ncbi:MAG TPA: PqiC family protein [Longimicrobiales bacterium]|nr:PqiC family protein [Longimicrobiales bacterium]
MHSMTIVTRSMLSLALIALAGCFGLNRGDPSQSHFVLGLGRGPAGAEATGPSGEVPGVAVGLRSLRLAEYLESPLIVVRRGPHRIELSEFHRWGEALDQGINRSVAGYMAVQGSFRSVAYAPWPTRSEQDFVIQLDILRFEGSAPDGPAVTEGEALLLASWEILRGGDGVMLARGTTEYHGPGWVLGDYDGLVGLLETGLSELADDLVEALASLSTP